MAFHDCASLKRYVKRRVSGQKVFRCICTQDLKESATSATIHITGSLYADEYKVREDAES